MNLHVVRIENGDFALEPLLQELVNIRNFYVLSRVEVESYKNDLSRWGEFNEKALERFKDPDSNSGEGGELLLYSLLEANLGAPKLLSKMELKTSKQHYVHGNDGIHVLEVAPGEYQLIFGESKMYGDTKNEPGTSLRNGLEAALTSIEKAQEEGFQFEMWLVDDNLLKEVVDPSNIEDLAEILLPPADGDKMRTKKSNAFGIFVGFEMDITDVRLSDLTLDEVEELLRDRAFNYMNEQVQWLDRRIEYLGLGGFPFHIYLVPFLKRKIKKRIVGLEEVRIAIAGRVGGFKKIDR